MPADQPVPVYDQLDSFEIADVAGKPAVMFCCGCGNVVTTVDCKSIRELLVAINEHVCE